MPLLVPTQIVLAEQTQLCEDELDSDLPRASSTDLSVKLQLQEKKDFFSRAQNEFAKLAIRKNHLLTRKVKTLLLKGRKPVTSLYFPDYNNIEYMRVGLL